MIIQDKEVAHIKKKGVSLKSLNHAERTILFLPRFACFYDVFGLQPQALNKYSLYDHGHGLRDRDVTLYLNWYTVPVSGILFGKRGEAGKMKLPSDYYNN